MFGQKKLTGAERAKGDDFASGTILTTYKRRQKQLGSRIVERFVYGAWLRVAKNDAIGRECGHCSRWASYLRPFWHHFKATRACR
jgi:hypothetical protein